MVLELFADMGYQDAIFVDVSHVLREPRNALASILADIAKGIRKVALYVFLIFDVDSVVLDKSVMPKTKEDFLKRTKVKYLRYKGYTMIVGTMSQFTILTGDKEMRCWKVSPSVILSETLAECFYQIMVETWQRVSEAKIVIWVIFRYVGKLRKERTFGKIFLIKGQSEEMNTPSSLLVILIVICKATQIVIILLLPTALVTLSARNGKNMLTSMCSIGGIN